jgi:hypothetical protein
MTVRLSGRELLMVCLASSVCINAAASALPWPEWGPSPLLNALIAVLTALVIRLTIRDAMRRDSTAAQPVWPSARERTVKTVVFYLLIVLIPIGAFLIRGHR